jgi:hypothetical protein
VQNINGFVTLFGIHGFAANLPAYAKTIGADVYAIGLLIGVYDLAELFAKPAAGLITDRRGYGMDQHRDSRQHYGGLTLPKHWHGRGAIVQGSRRYGGAAFNPDTDAFPWRAGPFRWLRRLGLAAPVAACSATHLSKGKLTWMPC